MTTPQPIPAAVLGLLHFGLTAADIARLFGVHPGTCRRRITTRALLLVGSAVSCVTLSFISIFLDVGPRVCAHAVPCLGPTLRKLREVKSRTRWIDCDSLFLTKSWFRETLAVPDYVIKIEVEASASRWQVRLLTAALQ